MIFVAGRKIERMEDLSESFRVISDLIEDAPKWLPWAFSEPAEAFWLSVRTEGELLTRMLEGLHGTALVKIDNHDQGLLIHPLKLLELANGNGVQLIDDIVNAKEDCQDLLKHNKLLSRTDLDEGLHFLADLDVNHDLIFQTMTLADQIQLVRLQESLKKRNIPHAHLNEAARFAIRRAQTAGEFSACFNYCLAVWGKSANACRTKAMRERKALHTWKTLAPLSYGLLETFSFSREVIWEKLADNIKSCLQNGFQLGFISLPKAICHIVAHTAYINQTGGKAQKIIKHHMDLACDTVVKGTLEEIRLSQDGITRSYIFTQSSLRTVLEVDTWGIVTLASCRATII